MSHKNTLIRWWWVRHAPVAWGGVYIYGHTDLACDCSDGAAFATLAARLPAAPAVVLCSALRRTHETCAALTAAGWNAPAPRVEPALAEQAFGAWEGLRWEEVQTGPEGAAFWASPFTHRPPGGESFLDVVARVQGVVERLLREQSGSDGVDIVALAHAGSIRAALSLALDLTPGQAHAIALAPLSLTRLDHVCGNWRVEGVNIPPQSHREYRELYPQPKCE